MAQHGTGVELVKSKGGTLGLTSKAGGGRYHRGERVVQKLRKATRSETTRAKQ